MDGNRTHTPALESAGIIWPDQYEGPLRKPKLPRENIFSDCLTREQGFTRRNIATRRLESAGIIWPGQYERPLGKPKLPQEHVSRDCPTIQQGFTRRNIANRRLETSLLSK